MDGIVVCNFCYERCLPNDFTTVHFERAGHAVQFTFHNIIERPCLKLKIEELRQQFSVAPPPNNHRGLVSYPQPSSGKGLPSPSP